MNLIAFGFHPGGEMCSSYSVDWTATKDGHGTMEQFSVSRRKGLDALAVLGSRKRKKNTKSSPPGS